MFRLLAHNPDPFWWLHYLRYLRYAIRCAIWECV